MEIIPFGILTFVVGALLVANAWAVIDAKMAVSAAAREATRAFVEATGADEAEASALAAARQAIAGFGRNPNDLDLIREGGFGRCETVRYEARYQIPAIRLPWVGGFGDGFTAAAHHAEVVDPYRTGLPVSEDGCVAEP
jgi:hypothetical protein